MKTFQQIYEWLKEPTDERFTLYELIKIFENESSWVGTPHQLLTLKQVKTEITGIRPGNCSGCNIDTLRDIMNWVIRYERENPEPPILKITKKLGRPKSK